MEKTSTNPPKIQPETKKTSTTSSQQKNKKLKANSTDSSQNQTAPQQQIINGSNTLIPIYLNTDDIVSPKDDIYYLLGKNGTFMYKKTPLADCMVKVDNISVLNPVEEHAIMKIDPIPAELMGQIVFFFRQVYKLYRSECVAVFHYNEKTKDWKLEVPKQKVSGASVDYHGALKIKNYLRIGTIHSHAGFGAFHSGTDDHDEMNFDGIHITLGSFSQPKTFSMAASIVFNGSRFKINGSDYMEGVMPNELVAGGWSEAHFHLKDEELGTKFPKEWLENVEGEIYSPPIINRAYMGNNIYNTYDFNTNIDDDDPRTVHRDIVTPYGKWTRVWEFGKWVEKFIPNNKLPSQTSLGGAFSKSQRKKEKRRNKQYKKKHCTCTCKFHTITDDMIVEFLNTLDDQALGELGLREMTSGEITAFQMERAYDSYEIQKTQEEEIMEHLKTTESNYIDPFYFTKD